MVFTFVSFQLIFIRLFLCLILSSSNFTENLFLSFTLMGLVIGCVIIYMYNSNDCIRHKYNCESYSELNRLIYSEDFRVKNPNIACFFNSFLIHFQENENDRKHWERLKLKHIQTQKDTQWESWPHDGWNKKFVKSSQSYYKLDHRK